MPCNTMTDPRRRQLEAWLAQHHHAAAQVELLAGDASFRRYFRARHAAGSYVVMDAPPDKEPLETYLRVTQQLRAASIHVPEVFIEDREQGFLLLEDLGDDQYLSRLGDDTADDLYGDAIDTLVRIQSVARQALPPYDEALLRRELNLFTDWYLEKHLQRQLNSSEQNLIEETWQTLISRACAQPRVVVHRDYHSRNLMVAQPNPGVIDHQDAVWGPISYDLVSLLRDCYIVWPEADVHRWVERYYRSAQDSGVLQSSVSLEQFLEWFDWMGVQRHLKATGIFARLNYRDGKPAYLDDVPRVLDYVREVCACHKALQPFGELVRGLAELKR